MPAFNKFSYEEFKKMRMIVGSRAYGVDIDKKFTQAFIPLTDMLNHENPK